MKELLLLLRHFFAERKQKKQDWKLITDLVNFRNLLITIRIDDIDISRKFKQVHGKCSVSYPSPYDIPLAVCVYAHNSRLALDFNYLGNDNVFELINLGDFLFKMGKNSQRIYLISWEGPTIPSWTDIELPEKSTNSKYVLAALEQFPKSFTKRGS